MAPKDWLKLAILTLTILIITVGCQTPVMEQMDQHAIDSPVILKMSGWGANPNEKRSLQQILREFEATHPHIKVKFEEIADQYMDVIKTRLIGDAAPDVFYLEAFEAPFLMEQGVLEPLDAYLTPEFDVADFEETLLSPFRYADRIYGLPKDCSTLALFYNQTAFAAAGLDRPPITWEELEADSQRLTLDRNQDGRVDQVGLGLVAELARQAFTIRSFGGQVVDQQGYATFAAEPGLRGLQRQVDQYRRDRTAAQASDLGASNTSELFGQGRAAMVLEGNWTIPYLTETFPDLKFATAEVPQMNQQSGTMVYTVAYVMNHQTRHKPEAWELIAYLTGKAGMETWTKTGFALPTRKSVVAKLAIDQDPLRAALIKGVDYATPWQVGKYPTAVVNSFNNQFVSAILGEQPLSQAMQKAQDAANDQIRAAQ